MVKRNLLFSHFLVIIFLSHNLLHSQSITDTDNNLKNYFDNKFYFGAIAGISSLRVLPHFFIEDEISELPRINMFTYGARIGKRFFFHESIFILIEAGFCHGKGQLEVELTDRYNPSNQKRNVKRDVSNTMFGGVLGLWAPIYQNFNNQSLFAPKAILVDIKIGGDIMLIREDTNQSYHKTYITPEGGQITITGHYDEEIIEADDRVLFSIGLGLDYVLSRHFLVKLEANIGAYPVSGPGNAQGEPTGPPDEWGNNRSLLIGLDFIL